MTQEQKDILLKDLCARVPYGVKFKHEGRRTIGKVLSIYPHRKWAGVIYFDDAINHPKECDMGDIKPYLFPLSSMTEEQLFEVQEILGKNEIKIEDSFLRIVDSDRNTISYLEIRALLNWFYKNHFDIYGLIPIGLAIDATNKNIY